MCDAPGDLVQRVGHLGTSSDSGLLAGGGDLARQVGGAEAAEAGAPAERHEIVRLLRRGRALAVEVVLGLGEGEAAAVDRTARATPGGDLDTLLAARRLGAAQRIVAELQALAAEVGARVELHGGHAEGEAG